MKIVIIISCVFGIALCVPVGTKDPQPTVAFPVQVDGTDQVEAIRIRRHLFDINVDVYNNNGFGYFDNGYGGGFTGYGYPGYGGGFGSYPGYGGGFGSYPGYGGGLGGYPGYGYPGGYPGYGYGGFGGYSGYGGFF